MSCRIQVHSRLHPTIYFRLFRETIVNKGVETVEQATARHKKTFEKIRNGLATKVRILANQDSCPVCTATEGAYDFDKVPALPMDGCSHPDGCRCFYEPVLDRFGP